MNHSQPTPVVCITYGHPAEMVQTALSSAIILAEEGIADPIILDDMSGSAPKIAKVRTLLTPANEGYSAAVNYAMKSVPTDSNRVVFVNPDAEVSVELLRRLLTEEFAEILVAPAIAAAADLENLRRTLSVRNVLMMLIAQRLGSQQLHPRSTEDIVGVLEDGWVPAGTVVAFDAPHLRDHPLDANMFWVEMSAWARENPKASFRILHDDARHEGGSTENLASPTVVASRLAAQVNYVRSYGRPMERLLLGPTYLLGRALQLLTRRTSLRGFVKLIRMYRGKLRWQHIQAL